MATSSYSIKDCKARHFTAAYADTLDFISFPSLLRAVADWIEAEGLSDDLIGALKFSTTFQGRSGDFNDPYYETATLYYQEEE